MILQSWKQIKYFTPEQFEDPLFPGSGIHINALTVLLLDKLRITINCPIIIHHKAGGAVDMQGKHDHAPKSYHLFDQGCRAVDCHIDTFMNVREQYNRVCQAGFSGIGVYLYGSHKGWFHVDTRPITETQHWVCKRQGQYEYFLP